MDDDPGLRESLAELLAATGYEVVTAWNSTDALRAIAEGSVDVLLTDLRMPGPNGMDLIEAAQRARPDLRAILMTAFPGEAAPAMSRWRSIGYLRKPFEADEVTRLVEQVLASEGREI